MITKAETEKKRRAQPEETLEQYLKQTLPSAGFTREWNTTMYRKFEEVFGDYYRDTSNDICMVPAFDAMELADALLYEISREVGFRQEEIKEHEKTKALVKTLSSEVDSVTKENQRLHRVIEESEEQRSSSETAKVNRLTKEMEELASRPRVNARKVGKSRPRSG